MEEQHHRGRFEMSVIYSEEQDRNIDTDFEDYQTESEGGKDKDGKD